MTKVDFAYAVVVLRIRIFDVRLVVRSCVAIVDFFSCGSFLNDLKFVFSVFITNGRNAALVVGSIVRVLRLIIRCAVSVVACFCS